MGGGEGEKERQFWLFPHAERTVIFFAARIYLYRPKSRLKRKTRETAIPTLNPRPPDAPEKVNAIKSALYYTGIPSSRRRSDKLF